MSPRPVASGASGRVRIEPLVAAARAASGPRGAPGWFVWAFDDGVAFRTVVRRWAEADEPLARLTRYGCGTAIYAARLAVAVQGRRPLVTRPKEVGLVAVLRPGRVSAPRPEVLAAYAALRHGGAPRSGTLGGTGSLGEVLHLRRAAETEGVWVRVIDPGPGPDLGPRWPDPLEGAGDTLEGPKAPDPVRTLLLGSPGRTPWADVLAGQAIEAVRLAAANVGLRSVVAAAPADAAALLQRLSERRREIGPDVGRGALAVVQVRGTGCPEITAHP